MLTQELGSSYTNESFRDRWFRLPSTGEICFLNTIGNSTAVVHKLVEEDGEIDWGPGVEVPSSEFVDLTVFQYPELGYRHTPNGKDLWNISRMAATSRRGICDENSTAINVTNENSSSWESVDSALKARLIFQPEFKGFSEAIRLLNAAPRGCRGWAISSNFAVSRAALGRMEYRIHFSGKVVGTVSEEGTVEIASRSINRLFQKVA